MKKYTEEDVFNKFRHIEKKTEFARFMDKYYDRICAMDLSSVKKHLPIDFQGFGGTYIDDSMIQKIEPNDHYPYAFRGSIFGWVDCQFMANVVTAVANSWEDLWKNMLLQYMWYLDGNKEHKGALNQFNHIVSCLPDVSFNTQLCTTVEQSRRLVELGLSFSTSDAYWICGCFGSGYKMVLKFTDDEDDYYPAWSLHRLIDMMPGQIYSQKDLWKLNISCFPSKRIEYYRVDSETIGYYNCLKSFGGYEISLYESVIQCIEWLVKKGYFNKEYLEERP